MRNNCHDRAINFKTEALEGYITPPVCSLDLRFLSAFELFFLLREFDCPAGMVQTSPPYGPPSPTFLANHLSVLQFWDEGSRVRSCTTSVYLAVPTLHKDRGKIPSQSRSLPRSTDPNPEIAELRMNPMPSPNDFSRPLNPYETVTLYFPNSATRSITRLRCVPPYPGPMMVPLPWGMRGAPH